MMKSPKQTPEVSITGVEELVATPGVNAVAAGLEQSPVTRGSSRSSTPLTGVKNLVKTPR